MKKIGLPANYFTKNEIRLWTTSAAFILLSFYIFDRENYLTLCASLVGVTSLIFNAKGNPYGENKAEVRVNEIGARETVYMWLGTAAVTVLFYFVLEYFDTSYLIPSTISVTTSFLAVYLTFRRSSSFALAYAANDVVLIVLWVLASLADARYVSVVVCFAAFLANDVYGYVNWQRIKIRQKAGDAAPERRPEAQSWQAR